MGSDGTSIRLRAPVKYGVRPGRLPDVPSTPLRRGALLAARAPVGDPFLTGGAGVGGADRGAAAPAGARRTPVDPVRMAATGVAGGDVAVPSLVGVEEFAGEDDHAPGAGDLAH